MGYGVPETGQEWMRQVEKRLMTQERRGPNLPGTFVPVPSQADQDSLVSWYQPTPVKPLLIDRTDTTTRPDLRYTKDGVLWWSIGATRLPAPFIAAALQNGWVSYGAGHAPAGFLRLSSGLVLATGLIRSGTTTTGTLLFTLPEGYRPATQLTFPVATNERAGRITVRTNGQVVADSVSNAWLSLSGIIFPTEALTWTQPALINGFVDYALTDPTWPPFAWAIDSLGRVWFRGLLSRNGASTPSDTAMFVLPAAARPAWQLHFAGIGTGDAFASLDVMPTGEVRAKAGAPTSVWLCLNGMRWVGAATLPEAGYTPLTLINSWASYGAGFPAAAYTILPDGLAISHGLIRGGTPPSNYTALPVGSRSASGTQVFMTNSVNAYGRHDVNLAALTAQGGSITWFSIDGAYWVPDS